MGTKKAAQKATGRPFEKGDKRINRTKPGPGRPRDEFKEMMRALASGEATQEQLQTILESNGHPHFMKALEYATSHGYGKATESLEVKGDINLHIAYTEDDE